MQAKRTLGSDYYNKGNKEYKENKENKDECGAPRSHGKPCDGGARLVHLQQIYTLWASVIRQVWYFLIGSVVFKLNNGPQTVFFIASSLFLTVLRIRIYYFVCFLFVCFFASGGGSPLYPEFLLYETMILQRSRIIEGDAGFEPGTSASEVWRATNEPPHLLDPDPEGIF